MTNSPKNQPRNEDVAPEGKRKRGRPKGRKTEPRPVVDTSLAVCPGCGKSGATLRPGNKPRMMDHPTAKDGVEYNAVRWDVVVCNHCPQTFTRKTLYNK